MIQQVYEGERGTPKRGGGEGADESDKARRGRWERKKERNGDEEMVRTAALTVCKADPSASEAENEPAADTYKHWCS